MIQTLNASHLGADQLIDRTIARYGARRVLLRAVAAMLTRKPQMPTDHLSNHLRKDIGLLPQGRPKHYTEFMR